MIETGVLFGNIHSFYDLGLVLSSVDIEPAQPKTNYVSIPGADGSIDLTEALGEVKYSDRTHKFTFTMAPSGGLSEFDWEMKKTEVSNRLNGLACKITLEKDPDYYWLGRCSVDEYKSDKRVRQFVVSATVRPYKYKHNETVAVFDLESTARTVSLQNGRKSVCPSITCTDNDTVVVFGDSTFTLSAGTHKVLNIRFQHGANDLTISGNGQITIRYQEGDL